MRQSLDSTDQEPLLTDEPPSSVRTASTLRTDDRIVKLPRYPVFINARPAVERTGSHHCFLRGRSNSNISQEHEAKVRSMVTTPIFVNMDSKPASLLDDHYVQFAHTEKKTSKRSSYRKYFRRILFGKK